MTIQLEDYRDSFAHLALRRQDGVLEVRAHTGGEPLVYDAMFAREFIDCMHALSADPVNAVVILTGTGDRWCSKGDTSSWHVEGGMTPEHWESVLREDQALLAALLNVPVPMIGAVNGPARVHPELPALCDVVLAADTAFFQDIGHFPSGAVPGDGSHVVWPALLGPNRGRAFLLTGSKLWAHDALAAGVVAEVLAPGELMQRAWELGRQIAGQPDLVRRYTRRLLTHDLKRALYEFHESGLAFEGLAAIQSAIDRAR